MDLLPDTDPQQMNHYWYFKTLKISTNYIYYNRYDEHRFIRSKKRSFQTFKQNQEIGFQIERI